MGTHSHLSIECYVLIGRRQWQWCPWALDVMGTQWDEMYAAMAGVRNGECEGIEPVSPPKGVPTNARAFHDGPGSHSHTWLTVQEYQEALRRARAYCPMDLPRDIEDWVALNAVLFALEQVYGAGHVRLLVSFDG